MAPVPGAHRNGRQERVSGAAARAARSGISAMTNNGPSPRHRLALLAACGLLVLLVTGCGRGPKKPNILLITLDTTRRNHLSCYGYARETTPNLDALAREGTLHENCINMTSWTLPSHASMFTGLYPTTHGAHYNEKAELSLNTALNDSPVSKEYRANGLGEAAVTLAETLREAGYATGGVGGGPWLKKVFGLAQGFDFYDCDVDSVAGRPANEVTNLAIPFLRDKAGAPFFLFLNYFDPHFPYSAPGKYQHTFTGDPPPPAGAAGQGRNMLQRITQYDCEIHYMDGYIGVLFDELKRLGVWDSTWIIVTADHGENFGEKGLTGHGFALYEETLRSPLIMKVPQGWAAIGDPAQRVQPVHLMPTILERLGITPAAPMDVHPMGETGGVAVAELYKNLGNVTFNAQGNGERFDRNLKAIYVKQYKLIDSTRANDEDAGLFDLAADPGETQNLAGELPEVLASMRDALSQWERSLGRPLDPLTIRNLDEDTEEQLKALGY